MLIGGEVDRSGGLMDSVVFVSVDMASEPKVVAVRVSVLKRVLRLITELALTVTEKVLYEAH